MQGTLPTPGMPEKRLRFSLSTFILAAVLVAAIALSLWFLFQSPQASRTDSIQRTINLKMGPVERDYVKNIRVENIALSRVENFLHQEVTILAGEIVNAGPQPILALALTVEFFDELKQVVLRESRSVLGTPPMILAPGERRSFEISFDHVPPSWNMQRPGLRVTDLRFATSK
jgi:hypothetical protein